MKVQTSSATPLQLDWAVAEIEYPEWKEQGYLDSFPYDLQFDDGTAFSPSTDWAQGGPIIERGAIDTHYTGQMWGAARQLNEYEEPDEWFGPTPLIAAMRCYVASKLGDEIEIPEDLK